MDSRTRAVLTGVWLVVAVLALSTVESLEPTVETGAALFAALLAVWVAAVYALNPRGLLDRLHG